jgi:hypothetical protein
MFLLDQAGIEFPSLDTSLQLKQAGIEFFQAQTLYFKRFFIINFLKRFAVLRHVSLYLISGNTEEYPNVVSKFS